MESKPRVLLLRVSAPVPAAGFLPWLPLTMYRKLNKPFLPSFPKQCFITATKSKPEQLGTRRKILPTPPKRKTGIKYQITYSPHPLSLGKILDPKQSQRDRDRHGMQETRNGPRKGKRCLPPRMMVKGDEKSRTRYPELVRGQDLWRALP